MTSKKSPDEFTGEDVKNTGFYPKSEDAITWEGHVAKVIGEQCEKQAIKIFNLCFDGKIEETTEAKTPDWIDCGGKYVIEVYSGRSVGKLDETLTEKTGIPCKVHTHNKRELRKRIKSCLKHAKEKDLDYVMKKYGLSERPTYISFYSIQNENMFWITDWNDVVNLVRKDDFDNYNVDCLIIYSAPNTAYSAKTLVFYKKGKPIDPEIFKYNVDMIEVQDN
ncbi:MAG: hypothetical protein FWD81_02490 [Methanomassiliicoccaceae archaeon]|nr:hypothetical protein [Methanomassiliicoccaceae archaeon]